MAAKSVATSISITASAIAAPEFVTVIRSCRPDSTKRTLLTCTLPPSSSNVALLSSAWKPITAGSTPLIKSRRRERMRVSPSQTPSPWNSPGLIDPSRAETTKKRSRLSMTRSDMSCPDEIKPAAQFAVRER